ncbi:MAG: UDP-N-acetylmuramoyl-tripeptide--D-alanyl-D-alanine ligase [Actinomycetales bacterium]|nr:MAG: UDP-N-acetylmuramoyl-tripeptide--D-alanyl-D-alanine ligase [Actinomycetales bacterium]
MIDLTLGEIAKIVDGKLINADPAMRTSASPVIDSRKVSSETFFVAFKGENMDGHDFVTSAIASGAPYVLVSREVSAPGILVADVTLALTKLSEFVRNSLKNLIVVGITGSQGKTTTKDLLKRILSISGNTVAPEESLNNELGVPLLLLRCDTNTKYCIVEMGARHLGDIAYLAKIVKPQIGVVLGVGKAHIGEFGDQSRTALAKSELIAALPIDGIAILGTYDDFTPKMSNPNIARTIYFGEKNSCEVRAADIEVREGRAHFDLVTPNGRAAVSLQLLGLHNIANALAAAAVASALGIAIDSIAAAISTAEAMSKWRMEIRNFGEIMMINDSYNANPESMASALRSFALVAQERGGVSWAFLGKMHELGASSALEHQEIGRLLSEIGIDNLVSVGTDAYLSGFSREYHDEGETQLHYFSSQLQSLDLVKNFAPGDVLLIKASRSQHFEFLADQIIETWEALQK